MDDDTGQIDFSDRPPWPLLHPVHGFLTGLCGRLTVERQGWSTSNVSGSRDIDSEPAGAFTCRHQPTSTRRLQCV